MSETIVVEPKLKEIRRFRCQGCGRVFDTLEDTPACCGTLQELEIPSPLEIAEIADPIENEEKDTPPEPKNVINPGDDLIERLLQREQEQKLERERRLIREQRGSHYIPKIWGDPPKKPYKDTNPWRDYSKKWQRGSERLTPRWVKTRGFTKGVIDGSSSHTIKR